MDQLKYIATRLNKLYHGKQSAITAISLHDDLSVEELLSLLSDIVASIEKQARPSSKHYKPPDHSNETFEQSLERLAHFLNMVNFPQAQDEHEFMVSASKDRDVLFQAMHFLFSDTEGMHVKRAYLAPFLESVDVPVEFSQDARVEELLGQLQELQEQFKETHRYVESLKQPGQSAGGMKQEIQKMEEEKQQITAKINKLQRRVMQVPNHEQWIESAKALRLEQQKQIDLAEKIQEQRAASLAADTEIANLKKELKEVQALAGQSPEAVYEKMMQEHKMNKYLATENLVKQIKDVEVKIDMQTQVLRAPAMSDSEIRELEAEVASLAEKVKQAEFRSKKNASASPEGSKIALFKQQADIILKKKEDTAQRLRALQVEVKHLSEECSRKRVANVKVLKGEEFKKYVAELRIKSTNYKKKKTDVSQLVAEYGILARTEELLKQREKAMKDTYAEVAKRAANNKAVDEKAVAAIDLGGADIAETIAEKKQKLQPIMQDLRSMRQLVGDMEVEYADKKKAYDATMAGLDSEAVSLDQEVDALYQEITQMQSKLHLLSCTLAYHEQTNDRIVQEMKSYIGGDDVVEAQQRARGFKSYRDMYTKRIQEQEAAGKKLRESQKDVKTSYEPNVKQQEYFDDLKKLMALKLEHNKQVLKQGGRRDEYADSKVLVRDRLVL